MQPDDAREWFSFEDDEEERTWVVDVTFLTSPWTCIYGRGCQGVLDAPAGHLQQGCCSFGAHFGDEGDRERVEAAAATLTGDQWQFRDVARRRGVTKQAAGGARMTRLVGGACIFLNRPGFPGGPGCALHRAALETGRNPMDLKPDVCWQLPLRRLDTTSEGGHVTSTISEWKRSHWGEAGEDFHWWCTEAPEAFTGHEPVYRTMEAELRALMSPAAYSRLVAYLDERCGPAAGVLLPHPALRT